MTFADTQKAFNQRFTYKAESGDNWQILKDKGRVKGDCEDYALTLIWLAEGRSLWRFWIALITFKYVIWNCFSPAGNGHAILWVRGHGWTDNIQRHVVKSKTRMKRLGYKLRFPFLFPLVALKFALRSFLSTKGE